MSITLNLYITVFASKWEIIFPLHNIENSELLTMEKVMRQFHYIFQEDIAIHK